MPAVDRPPPRPPWRAASDLSDAEFAELDELLAGIPEPLEPLDASCSTASCAACIVQPRADRRRRAGCRYVFDAGGHRWGEAEPSPEQLRAREPDRCAAMRR